MTAIASAIQELKAERDRLDDALSTLIRLNGSGTVVHRKTRVISAAARAKMRAAQIRRWKKVRAAKAAKRG